MADVKVLVLPGLGGSGPSHWQTLWEHRYAYERVTQDDWDRPSRESWVKRLDRAVALVPGKVALVAHSLACATVAHWAGRAPAGRVVGALMVAPADVDSCRNTPPETHCFAPMPLAPLPFPATVIASTTDPYVDLARAQHFAACWGATFVNVLAAGHINADSGLAYWPDGHLHLARLLGHTS